MYEDTDMCKCGHCWGDHRCANEGGTYCIYCICYSFEKGKPSVAKAKGGNP